jgi:hypothetical protein
MATVRAGVSASANSGYYRSAPPRVGGVGSGAGPSGIRASGQGSPGWHPTVAYLMVLVVLEFAAAAGLRYAFRHAHGG